MRQELYALKYFRQKVLLCFFAILFWLQLRYFFNETGKIELFKVQNKNSIPRVHIVLTACGEALYGEDAMLTVKSILAETIPSTIYLVITIIGDESPTIKKALVNPLQKLVMEGHLEDKSVQVDFVPAFSLPQDFEVTFGKCASQRLFFPENP